MFNYVVSSTRRARGTKRGRKWKSRCRQITFYSVKPKFPPNSFKWHDNTAQRAPGALFSTICPLQYDRLDSHWRIRACFKFHRPFLCLTFYVFRFLLREKEREKDSLKISRPTRYRENARSHDTRCTWSTWLVIAICFNAIT